MAKIQCSKIEILTQLFDKERMFFLQFIYIELKQVKVKQKKTLSIYKNSQPSEVAKKKFFFKNLK